jgi:hypothetical protein
VNIGLNIGFIMADKPFSFHPDFRDERAVGDLEYGNRALKS